MALTKEDLQAIRALMQEENAPLKADIADLKAGQLVMQEDIDQIKEDTAITRDVVNGISEWVEVASDVLKIKYPVKE